MPRIKIYDIHSTQSSYLADVDNSETHAVQGGWWNPWRPTFPIRPNPIHFPIPIWLRRL